MNDQKKHAQNVQKNTKLQQKVVKLESEVARLESLVAGQERSLAATRQERDESRELVGQLARQLLEVGMHVNAAKELERRTADALREIAAERDQFRAQLDLLRGMLSSGEIGNVTHIENTESVAVGAPAPNGSDAQDALSRLFAPFSLPGDDC